MNQKENGKDPDKEDRLDEFNEVKDEEGLVDRKTKDHILDLRKQIDEDERRLFVNMHADSNTSLSMTQATQYWSVTIKQYLRAIKRLWGSTKDTDDHSVKGVRKYWIEKEIGVIELPPPDTENYRFSLCADEELSDEQLRNRLNLPRDAEIPRPVEKRFHGLNSILEQDVIEQTWQVWVEKEGARPNWDDRILHQATPIPKSMLETAVEEADNFLQQAGIGFNLGDNLPTDGI